MRSAVAVISAGLACLVTGCNEPRAGSSTAFHRLAEQLCGPGYAASPSQPFHGFLTLGENARAYYPYRGDVGQSIRAEPRPLDYGLLNAPGLADTQQEQALVNHWKTSLGHAEYEVRFDGRQITGTACAAVIVETLLDVREVTMRRGAT